MSTGTYTIAYDPPPIPGWEKMAWKATCDLHEGTPIGFGSTPQEALQDLIDKEEEI